MPDETQLRGGEVVVNVQVEPPQSRQVGEGLDTLPSDFEAQTEVQFLQ